MAFSDIFHTTIDTCLLPTESVVYACNTCNPGGIWHSLPCSTLEHPMGVTITWVSRMVHLRYLPLQDFHLKWTNVATAFLLNDCIYFFLFRCVCSLCTPSSCISPVTMRHNNNCARWTVAQGVEIWSISLSLITLITRARVQVLITIGTHLPKVDLSGTTKNTTSSSYLATSLTCSLVITNPRGHVCWPPSQTKCNG